MPRVSKKVKELAAVTGRDVFSRFTYGFELETQASDGLSRDALEQQRRKRQELFDQFKHLLVGDVSKVVDNYFNNPGGLALIPLMELEAGDLESLEPRERALITLLSSYEISVNSCPEGQLPNPMSQAHLSALGWTKPLNAFLPSSAKQAFKEYVQKSGTENKHYPHRDLKDYLKHMFKPSKYIDVGTDSSVRGFEFRTIGGLELPQFLEAADSLFKTEHEIDECCSFHIHVQAKDVTHTYGENIQRHCIEYVLNNIHRLPTAVLNRWKYNGNEQMHNYFRPETNERKHTFVNYNGSYETWEFRCFGNVRSKQEARQCVLIAVKALHHAYQVMAGLKTPYFNALPSLEEAYKMINEFGTQSSEMVG